MKAQSMAEARIAVKLQLLSSLLGVFHHMKDRIWTQAVTLNHTQDRNSALWRQNRRGGWEYATRLKVLEVTDRKESSFNDIFKCSLVNQSSTDIFRSCNQNVVTDTNHVIVCSWRITARDTDQNSWFSHFLFKMNDKQYIDIARALFWYY